ncbi:serpin B6-like [Lycorma delicatula]|uniref:serpin B6-like n=1 Tax=Lycorma delicatula TaxID=130591 RepID=UPI003F512B50
MTFTVTTSVILLAASLLTSSEGSIENDEIISQSNGIFSHNLFKRVSSEGKNVFVSPLSLTYALIALSLGASGNTLKEMRKVYNLPDNEEVIKASFKKFTSALKEDKSLKIATNIFLDHKFHVESDFKNALTSTFDAGIDNVDFAQKPEESRGIINNYVDKKTNHLISELFEQGSISADTFSILVNVIYFKSKWRYPFSIRRTSKELFYGLDKNYETDMMYLPAKSLEYKEDHELDAQLLVLPYEGDYSCFIMLPKKKNGITDLENKLEIKAQQNKNSSPFIEAFSDAKPTDVEVFLPKFKIEQTFELSTVLQEMGIRDAFRASANFSRMTPNSVYISSVIQKTYIKVDETSTEAAAATGITVTLTAAVSYPEPIIFRADYPFQFAIVRNSDKTIIFCGKFSLP